MSIEETKLIQIQNAWLGLEGIDTSNLFIPTDFVSRNQDDFQYRLSYLLSQPEYFSFICKEVFNIQLLPMQCLILEEVWQRKFPMLIASRGLGKSFLLSLYAMLRALMLDGRKIVIVGSAFRQSKVLFEYMETIWNAAPILRTMCSRYSGPRKEQDRYVMHINNSRIVCLPLGDGQKIRGQRANDIIADEFACLKAGSIVETSNGFIRIEDFENAYYIKTGDKKKQFESPIKFIKTPPTDVYEVKLQNGYVIRCSENHQVMTNKGWKKPLELTENYYIEKSDKKTIFAQNNPAGLNNDLAWLMGILVSEGCITDKKRISVTTTDLNLCTKLINEFGFKFNIRKAYIDDRGWNCKESYRLYLDDKELRDKLYSLGLDYHTAHNKIVPWSVLQSREDTILKFLSGLFDGDGSCFLWQDKEVENKIGLAYYSVSERLCRDVQFLAEKFGYDGYINNRKSEISNNLQWFVRWNNNQAKDFADNLYIDRFKNTIKNCVVTDEPTYITWDKDRSRWKVQYNLCGKLIQKRFKHKEYAYKFVDELKEKDKYRKVISVVKLDKKESLYDYYLPITHSFYAEGHRQHNSIPREIFENVVAGFAAVSSSPIENVRRLAARAKAEELGISITEEAEQITDGKQHIANQITLSGTAYYEFNHFAEYWKKWKKVVQSKGDPNRLAEVFGGSAPPKDFDWTQYSIIRVPYELAPPGFMDADQVARSKATVHSGIYAMEFGAIFTRDSQGFFKRSLIESCVPSTDNVIKDHNGNAITFDPMLMGDPKKKYIFGVDPASEVDNFSIIILEMNGDHRKIVHCWTTNRSEHKELQKSGFSTELDFYSFCAKKIRDLMRRFPCIHIAMDAQGGGIAVSEALHDPDKIKSDEIAIWPIIDPDKEADTDDHRGLHILEMCQFAKYDWLSEANHGLKKDLEDKVLLFPNHDALALALSVSDDKLKGRAYDTMEDCVLDIEELKDELSIIEISQTNSGRDKWDTPEVIIGVGRKSRVRKDRYSALLMANMAARVLDRTPSVADYQFYGGFANTKQYPKKGQRSGDVVSGPAWIVDGMRGVY